MKPLLFAGLALALSVPAWSQPQQAPPPASDDRRAPDDGPPQVGGPIQLQNPHRRGDGRGPMMAGGRSGGSSGNFPGALGDGFNDGRTGFFGDSTMPMVAPSPVSMFADDRYLFILRGDTLMQFDKKTLTLLKSVELPRPTVNDAPLPFVGGYGQGGASVPSGQLRSQTSPPLLRRPDGATRQPF